MIASLARFVSLCVLAAGLAGCASDEQQFTAMPREPGRSVTLAAHQKPVQCVPYAREHSSVKIFGDAWTWWDQAAGKYPQGAVPLAGAVMVLSDYAGPDHGHVAVVRKLISPREIRVDHANWLDDGSIYINDPVEDVSAENNWSQVRVYNIKTGGWGAKVYPVKGFIGGSSGGVGPTQDDNAPDVNATPDLSAPDDDSPPDLVAQADIPQDGN